MRVHESNNSQQADATQRRPTAIDVHNHAMPLPLLEWLERAGLSDLSRIADGIVLLDPSVSGVGKNTPLPLARSQYDPRTRLAEMDDVGVSAHAVSMPPFLYCSNSEDRGLVTTTIARGNDELAGYVAEVRADCTASGRSRSVSPTPPTRLDAASTTLGFPGVAIGTRGGGKELDDPVNEDLWALLAERNAFIFVHPSGVPDAHRQRDFYLPQLVGYPAETAISIARMIYGGVFERFDLTMCLAHGGGCLPWLRGRLDLGWQRKDVAHTTEIPTERILQAAVLRHRGVRHHVCSLTSSRTWASTGCSWAPTTPSNLATPNLSRPSVHSASATTTRRRSSGAQRIHSSARRCRLRPRPVQPSIGSNDDLRSAARAAARLGGPTTQRDGHPRRGRWPLHAVVGIRALLGRLWTEGQTS